MQAPSVVVQYKQYTHTHLSVIPRSAMVAGMAIAETEYQYLLFNLSFIVWPSEIKYVNIFLKKKIFIMIL